MVILGLNKILTFLASAENYECQALYDKIVDQILKNPPQKWYKYLQIKPFIWDHTVQHLID